MEELSVGLSPLRLRDAADHREDSVLQNQSPDRLCQRFLTEWYDGLSESVRPQIKSLNNHKHARQHEHEEKCMDISYIRSISTQNQASCIHVLTITNSSLRDTRPWDIQSVWSVSSNTASPVSSVVYERLALSQYGEHSKHVNVNIHVQENEKPNNPQLGSLKHHTNGHTYKATSHTTLCLRLSKNAERGRTVTGQALMYFPLFLFFCLPWNTQRPSTLNSTLPPFSPTC